MASDCFGLLRLAPSLQVRQRGERPVDKPPREKEWSLPSLYELHRRRYLLRASALELFFRDATPVFINLREKPARRRLLSKLRYACPRAHVISPTDTKWVAELSSRWKLRQISNFEFLMRLNTLAGRTYNDPNQYAAHTARRALPWALLDMRPKLAPPALSFTGLTSARCLLPLPSHSQVPHLPVGPARVRAGLAQPQRSHRLQAR